MTQLGDLLTTKAGKDAHPLVLVTASGFKSWAQKQPARLQNWMKTQAFEGKAGSYCTLPSKDGGVEKVIAVLSEPVSMWNLAGLPKALPQGLYALEGKLDTADLAKLCTGWILGGYSFHAMKSKKDKAVQARLFCADTKAVAEARRMATVIVQVRDLITMPASHLGPEELAATIKETLAGEGTQWTEIVGEALVKQNFPAIYEVGKASPRKPRLVDVQWGNPKHPLVTIVGKGVVFDTGGLDLKPSSAMYLMRKDMGGAAIALGLASLILQGKLPVRLRLLVPVVENAVSGNAFRPSDVIKMRNGLTVEVGNTDAEGRLILADALALASEEKPALLIDFATLTGAARSAVGTGISAYFTDDKGLAADLDMAGEAAEDPVWRLPLFDAYDDMLKSSFADVNSAPASPYAGAITAALFLRRFVGKDIPWLHIDFMAWNTSGKAGRPEGGEAMALRAVYGMIRKRFGK